jgi:hypothetical protein
VAGVTNWLGYQEVWIGGGPTAARRDGDHQPTRSQAFTARVSGY